MKNKMENRYYFIDELEVDFIRNEDGNPFWALNKEDAKEFIKDLPYQIIKISINNN